MLLTLATTAWILLAVATALCNTTKTASSGTAIIVVALCTAALPAKESTGTILLILATDNLLAMQNYRSDTDFHMLRRPIPAVLIGVGASTLLPRLASNDSARRLIGVILLILVVITPYQHHSATRNRPNDVPEVAVPPSAGSRPVRLAYGSLADFTMMVTSAGGPMTSTYLPTRCYPIRAFLGTTAWFSFLVSPVKLPFSASAGLVNPATLSLTAVVAPVVITLALAGRRLTGHMDQRVFELIVVVLVVVPALLLLR